MLSVSYLFEDIATRREVGQGIGGAILGGLAGYGLSSFGGDNTFSQNMINSVGLGTLIGTAGGSLLGRKIGGNQISNPDEAADFNKASHRIGYLANVYSHPLAVAGNLINGNLGRRGANLYNAVADNGGAAKIGYKTTGRLATYFMGPIAGIFKPDNVNPNKR